jgi:hypothetical protein
VYRLRPSWPRWGFAPPVQSHDTYTQRARNFALRFPLRRQIICLCQLRRDFDARVPFLLSHSGLYSTSDIRLFGLLVNFAWSKRWSICSGLDGCVGHWRGGASSVSVIHDEVVVWVRHTQLPPTSLLQGLNAFGIPPPFDSTNGRQTALVGSKVLCYLLGTIHKPLQLDPCCINKKSVNEVFCCARNEHDATRSGSECGTCVRTFTAPANAVRLAAKSGPPGPARLCIHTPVPRGGPAKTGARRLRPIARARRA